MTHTLIKLFRGSDSDGMGYPPEIREEMASQPKRKDSVPDKQPVKSIDKNNYDMFSKDRAIKKKAEWLSYCLEIGWEKSQLDALSDVWDRFKDENGNLRPEPTSALPDKQVGVDLAELEKRIDASLTDESVSAYIKDHPILADKQESEEVNPQFDYFGKVITDRISYFTNRYHKYEAKELHDALNVVLRLVPPSDFENQPPKETGQREAIAALDWFAEQHMNYSFGGHRIEIHDGCFYWDTDEDGDQELSSVQLSQLFLNRPGNNQSPKTISATVDDLVKLWEAAIFWFDNSGGPADSFVTDLKTYLNKKFGIQPSDIK